MPTALSIAPGPPANLEDLLAIAMDAVMESDERRAHAAIHAALEASAVGCVAILEGDIMLRSDTRVIVPGILLALAVLPEVSFRPGGMFASLSFVPIRSAAVWSWALVDANERWLSGGRGSGVLIEGRRASVSVVVSLG